MPECWVSHSERVYFPEILLREVYFPSSRGNQLSVTPQLGAESLAISTLSLLECGMRWFVQATAAAASSLVTVLVMLRRPCLAPVLPDLLQFFHFLFYSVVRALGGGQRRYLCRTCRRDLLFALEPVVNFHVNCSLPRQETSLIRT